jgi:tRNA A58 N-methylase Trm61
VIIQEAPGVLRQERRYAEEAPPPASEPGTKSVLPFDPLPQDVLERMLVLAAVKKGDTIYDLGTGDGRILIAAARKYGVRGVGFEIDPGLAKLARENVRGAKLEKLVEIREQDFRSADLSGASVVTLYLSYDGNLAVREQLWRQLRPGARVVSYTFDMGDWPAKIAESYRDSAGNVHTLYFWEVAPASVASRTSEPPLQPQSNRGPLIIDVR